MTGYAELIQTMAAMVIFSIILMSANRMMQRNDLMQVEGELEREVIAVAQDILDESRTMEFDEVTVGTVLPPTIIPDNFTNPGQLGPDDGTLTETSRAQFDDFDDYHGWTDSVETEHGYFYLTGEVTYVDADFNEISTESTFKRIQIFVSNKFLKKPNSDEEQVYTFEFIRNYYAD